MPSFPKLKTGSVAQYGCVRTIDYSSRVSRFIDGTTQRFAVGSPRRAWRISLTELSAQEAETFSLFVNTHLETQELFTFTDPISGTEYSHCALADSSFKVSSEGEHLYEMEILIEQRQVLNGDISNNS